MDKLLNSYILDIFFDKYIDNICTSVSLDLHICSSNFKLEKKNRLYSDLDNYETDL